MSSKSGNYRSQSVGAQVRALQAADRQAKRKATDQARQDTQDYQQRRLDDAAEQTAAVGQQMSLFASVLRRSLAAPPQPFDFDKNMKSDAQLPLDLGADAHAATKPVLDDFMPAKPTALTRLVSGEGRYERARAAAEASFKEALVRHAQGEAARQNRVAQKQRRHADELAALQAEVVRHNKSLTTQRDAVNRGDRHAVSKYFQHLLNRIPDPKEFPRLRRVGYLPESTLLAIEWELPSTDVVPAHTAFKWVKTRDEIVGTSRSIADIRKTYQQLVSQIALRALHAVFAADTRGLVQTIVFNGHVRAIEPSTGHKIEPCLITLRATRQQFEALVLADLDAVACVQKYFAASVSPHPDELAPVEPLMDFKTADPRIIDPIDVISQLDPRPNLLDLSSKDFEHFIQNLFSLMGYDTHVLKASGDGGVDCIAYDRSKFKAKYVIQAKLFSDTVKPTYVRDLYGTVLNEGAALGILVTTSGFGQSSYEFINGKPLHLISGSNLLALCQEHGVPARILPKSKKK